MASHIGRRKFLATLGGAAAAWPLAARAQQQPAMPVIGFISAGSRDTYAELQASFRQGLKEGGYVEGQTVAIESRWADGQLDRLPRLAADLVERRVAVIVTTGGSSSRAALAASSTIPIVFLSQSDPINSGFVASFNRPGGNATGIALLTGPLVAKRLEIVLQLAPVGAPVGYLMNPQDTREAGDYLGEAPAAAQAIGQRLIIVNASRQHDMTAAFAALVDQRAGALIVSTDPYLFGRRNQIIALAARHSLPTIYDRREYAAAGGLITYGTHLADAYRQIGVYAGRILKGEKPADLPVVQPTKFELVINLGIAKALRLQIPDRLLALADEVIE
jgi:putative tryptophan/tyrosine transport system substrate-binding protein